jgi:serine/threonine-protein kinase PpkA
MDFPGYRIEGEIGKGGMASVYLAVQQSLHRLVALKVMEPRLAANENFAERFLKEGRIIACLDHSQIVTVYDFGAYKNNYYLSMEYFPGGTLEQKIRNGLALEEVISIIKIISKALGYAHSQGVLHRDIKPQNILFRKDGSPVLTDFGIARFVDDTMQLTAPGFTVGSPLYMSPERIMGKKIDARSDLYSLGVLFYQMLTAQLPYQADNSIGVALKQCSAPIPVLPRELSKFQVILEKLLAKNPEDRFATADAFVEELNRIETARLPSFWLSLPKLPGAARLSRSKKALLSYKRWALAGMIAATFTAGVYFTVDYAFQELQPPLASYFKALPKANNQRSPLATRYEALAIDHLNERNIDQSLNLIAIGLNAVPEDERLLALRSRIQNFYQAEEFLEQAKQQQQAGDLRDSLILIQQGLGLVAKHPELVALREEIGVVVKNQQQEVDEHLQQARNYEQNGELLKAFAALEKGLELAPDHESLLALRHEVKSKQQQALSRILRQVGEYRRSGALKETLTALQAGLKLVPNHPVLRKIEVQVTSQIEQQDKAITFLERAQRSYANKAYDDSLKIIQQGLQLAPGHPGLRNLQNKAATALEQQEEIAQLLAQCAEHFRANRLTSGRQDNAVICYRAILQRDPTNTKAMAGLEQVANRYIVWAMAASQRGNLSVAQSYLTRLKQVDPNHPKLAALQAELEKPLPSQASSEVVARAQFTTGIKEREPIDRIASVIPVQNNRLPLYYFTEIRNMSGETITHLWKYNGNIVSKKSFDIGGSRWRVYSRKDLAPEMTGRWQVIVVDSSGRTLDSSSFVYNALKSAEKNKS